MKTEMTEFELFSEVQKFYTNYLTLDKAIKLFELEHGYQPEIVEDKNEIFVNPIVIANVNKANGNDSVTVKSMRWMRKMQMDGSVNMIVGQIRNLIQTTFLVSRDEAVDIHKAYIDNYEALYFVERTM